MSKRLFVGNLPFTVRDDALRSWFEFHGYKVIGVKVVTERETGRSRGYGFVDVADETDVRRAIGELNGKQLEGRSLTIDAAKREHAPVTSKKKPAIDVRWPKPHFEVRVRKRKTGRGRVVLLLLKGEPDKVLVFRAMSNTRAAFDYAESLVSSLCATKIHVDAGAECYVKDEYTYLGNFSAVDPVYSRYMLCDHCKVCWTGCWDNFQCPICGEGELPTSNEGAPVKDDNS